MEIGPMSTTPLSITSKSPEPESETPSQIQPAKTIFFTNGVPKRRKPQHHHHPHAPPIVITYRECLKNHAATLGGHALDGCGEFMPSPTATPTDPTSLKCAACGCHRNFHRREPEDPPPLTATVEYQSLHRHHPPPPASHAHRSPNSASPPPISSSYYPSAPHMLLALSGGLTVASDNARNNSHLPPAAGALTPNTSNLGSNSKKRFRTKFTQLQKDKMLEFSERIGWRIQKKDEQLIQEFCDEVGVDRGVLKVWMHNNKNNFGKKDQANGEGGGGGGGEGNGGIEISRNNSNNLNGGLNREDENNKSHGNNNNHGQNLNYPFPDCIAHIGTNGSSSSS